MKFIKETFLNLQPVERIKRTPIAEHSGLYLEQNKTGFTFQLKYTSPETGNYRFMKLVRFKYGDNINKKMLDNILKQFVINQGIIAQGIDPIERKRTVKKSNKPKKKSKTVNQVFDVFTETRHFNTLAKSTTNAYLNNYRLHIADHWGKREITSVKRPEVVTFLNDIKKDSVFNSAIKIFQRIQEQAIDLGIIEAPFLFNVKSRADGIGVKALNDSDIIALMGSTTGWDGLRNIAKMQLLTACRISEVAGMRWEEIDMKAKTWTIPAQRVKTERAYKKMNRPHILPLMSKMSEILLQQRQYGTSGLVFKKSLTTRTAQEHYHNSAISIWLKEQVNITGGTHQLRRTVASRLSEQSGVSEYDIKL